MRGSALDEAEESWESASRAAECGGFAAGLIAGGYSRRMGVRDKAMLEWCGEPMWLRQLKLLESVRPERLLVSARAEQAWLKQLPAQVELVLDPPNGAAGPLGGITRCLAWDGRRLLVVGVDLPCITGEMLVRTLLSRIQQDKGVFLKGPHGFEPLVALYHPCMLGVMRHALKERRLSLQSVIWECLEEGLAVEVPMSSDDEAALINLNRPEDWERLDLRRAQGNEGDGLSPVGT